jgi:hypothetical protein
VISITMPEKLAHHALKLAWLLLAGGLIIPTYHQPWWMKGVAMVPLFIGTLALMAATLGHRPEECSRCKPRSRERLGRVHYRLWRSYGRYGWVVLAVVAMAWIVTISFDEELAKHGSQTLPAEVFWVGIVTMGALYVSARQFTTLNDGFARPRPILHFVQEHCVPLMHKSQKLIIAALVLNLVAMALVPRKGPWSLLGVMVSMSLLAAVYLCVRHSASLCETCVDEVEIPIDAAEQAARNRWRFTLVHKSALALPLVMMVMVIAPHWLSNMWDVALQGVFDVLMVGSMLLSSYHSSFQPWCPYCGWGDGGHGEDEEVPDPTPDKGRPLPV